MNHNDPMAAKLASFLVWLIAAASAVHWGMKLFVQAPGAPAQAELVSAQPAARADFTRVLGAEAPVVVAAAVPVPADARFRLLGVVTPRSGSAPAVALIAVGDKPPRAYRVGAVVDGEHVLQDVQARGASLGPAGGAAKVSLALPVAPSRPGQAFPGPAAPAPYAPYAAPSPVMPQAPNPSSPTTVPEVMPPMQVEVLARAARETY